MIVHFNDAQPGQRRYALWPDNARTGLICGAPVAGKSYCPEHHALVYEKSTRATPEQIDKKPGLFVKGQMPLVHRVDPEFEELK